MKRFYISDMHLFHKTIISDCDRPYKSLKEMHNDFIIKWNRKVGKNDMVYVVGDVATTSNEEELLEVVNIFKILNGKKILIIGNHDRDSIRNFKFRKCFIDIKEYARIYDGGKKIVIFHCPMEYWEGDKKGVIHIHGHVHNEPITKKDNRYNVSADVIDFEPKTLDEIMSCTKISGDLDENKKDT